MYTHKRKHTHTHIHVQDLLNSIMLGLGHENQINVLTKECAYMGVHVLGSKPEHGIKSTYNVKVLIYFPILPTHIQK